MATYVGCDDDVGTKWNSGRRSEIVVCMRNADPSMIVKAEIDNNVGSFYYGPRVSDLNYSDCLKHLDFEMITQISV